MFYYAAFWHFLCSFLHTRNKKTIVQHLLTKKQSKENIGTLWQLQHNQREQDRISKGKLFEEDYIDAVKGHFYGKIYLKKYMNEGISPKDAAKVIMDEIMAEKNTDTANVQYFYDLFKDHEKLQYIEFKDDKEKADLEYVRDNICLKGSFYIPATQITVLVPKDMFEGKPVFIEFADSKKCDIYTDNNGKRGINRKYFKTHVVIVYENGAIYINSTGKYRQATIRDIVSLFYSHHGMQVLDSILEIPAIKDSYVFKDLIKDCVKTIEDNSSFPSILWNQCIGYKNRNQLMQALYKHTEGIDFNKMGIPCGYAYMKTRPYVDEMSQGILYNAFTQHVLTGYTCRNARKRTAIAEAVAKEYLSDKLLKLYPERTFDIPIEVRDYVVNILASKGKVSLRWRSITKMVQRNVDVILTHQNAKTPNIIIPKKSRFNALADILPAEFERIKTRDRIIQEGQIMRHCVASYADLVNKDQCAIYHLTYMNREYTLEFKIQGDVYQVVQIQSKADRGAPKEVWDYVNGIIQNITVDSLEKSA